MQYEKPEVRKFGSFRDLTQVGAAGTNDVLSISGPVSGCLPTSSAEDCRLS